MDAQNQPADENREEVARKILRLSSKNHLTVRATEETSRLINSLNLPGITVPVSNKGLRHTADVTDDFWQLPICNTCKKVYPKELPEVCKNICRDGTICNQERPKSTQYLAYKPLPKAIKGIMRKISNFDDLCDCWHVRDSGPYYTDVYDGEKWMTMHPWLNQQGYTNLLLQFNIDWFNPYHGKQYSFGAIYMTILNLPRHIRYCEDYMLTIACIPGPAEPQKGQLNEIMAILVKDLNRAQEFSSGEKNIRVRLFNNVSDLPATRASMGFMGHNAAQGCSRCKIDMLIDKTRIGEPRTHYEHLQVSARLQGASNKTEMENISKTTGYRDAAILCLTYFHPVEDHAIDAMHNLCSGIPKRLFGLCQPNVEVLKKNLAAAGAPAALIDNINTSAMTSHNYKVLCEDYAHTFHGTISLRKLNLFYMLKMVMIIALSRCVSEDSLDQLDRLTASFVEGVKEVFGSAALTCNSHMLLHLSTDIRRFGPCPSNWCFPYERFNRTLKNINRNNHNIAPQIMREIDQLSQLTLPTEISPFSSFKPMERIQMQDEAPLMDLQSVTVKFAHKRRSALTLDAKRAIYEYCTENGVATVNHLQELMSVKVYGEVLLPNTCLWIKKDEKALQLQHLVAVNESFIAMLGLRFYDQTDVQAGGLIRRWQFKGEILEAYSPYAFSEILSVSSREILGVRHYTTEVCQSNYAY